MEEYNYLIEEHKNLIEKDKRNGTNKAYDFVKLLLNKDRGRNFPYSYSTEEQEFLNSDYLSYYFKDGIRRMITEEIQIAGEDLVKKIITERNNLWSNILNSGEPATEEEEKKLAELDKNSQILEQEGITSVPRELVTILENFVNSNRTTKEMTDDEIKAVFEVKKNRIKTENNNIMNCFYDYLFKLDCNNIADYIKNNIEPYDIASYLLYTSGLYDREAYSSGVEWSYLNQNHLTSIFNKLYMLDKNYALEFVKMIKKLNVLEPNKFIRLFYALTKNNFKFVVEEGQEKKCFFGRPLW